MVISPANFTRNHRHRTYTKLFEILILFKRNQLEHFVNEQIEDEQIFYSCMFWMTMCIY